MYKSINAAFSVILYMVIAVPEALATPMLVEGLGYVDDFEDPYVGLFETSSELAGWETMGDVSRVNIGAVADNVDADSMVQLAIHGVASASLESPLIHKSNYYDPYRPDIRSYLHYTGVGFSVTTSTDFIGSVSLFAGDNTLFSHSLSSGAGDFDVPRFVGTGWGYASSFDEEYAGLPLSLTISSTRGSALFGTVTLAYRVVQVPEPATLALFGLGIAGLGFSRRKKA